VSSHFEGVKDVARLLIDSELIRFFRDTVEDKRLILIATLDEASYQYVLICFLIYICGFRDD
jgi:hypothetical protein